MKFRRLLLANLFVLLQNNSAFASNCSAYPNTLANGTIANADQVMANFNNILNCANNSLAPTSSPTISNPTFTGIANFGGAINLNNSSLVNQYGDLLLNKSGGGVGINLNAATTMAFQVNGSAGGISGWQVYSDERLKKNIRPISDGIELINRLRPVRFNWRSVTERAIGKALTLPISEGQIGFIAQEVQKVVPEAVAVPKNSDDAYRLEEQKLIPIMVQAIKDQQAEIVEQRAKISKLETRLAALGH